MKKIFISLFFILFFYNILLIHSEEPYENPKYYTVQFNNVKVVNNPKFDAPAIELLKKGEIIEYLGERDYIYDESFYEYNDNGVYTVDYWIKIKTKNNKIGWVFEGFITNVISEGNIEIKALDDKIYVSKTKKILFFDTKKEINSYKISTFINNTDNIFINKIIYNLVDEYIILFPNPPGEGPFTCYCILLYNKNNNTFTYINSEYMFSFFHGISPSKKYLAFDAGDSPTGRGLLIYSLKENKKIFKDFPYIKSGWKNGDRIELTYEIGKKLSGYPDVNEENKIYFQKAYWEDGKLIKLKQYFIDYEGM